MNWLLIRGLSREARHWGEMPSILSREYPNSKVLCLDLPGAGTNNKIVSPLNIEEYVNFLRPLYLKEIQKTNGNWSILCISLGGMIALKWTELYPNDFKSLSIINTSAANIAIPIERMGWRNFPLILRIALSNNIRRNELAILNQTINLKSPTEFIDKWEEIQSTAKTTKMNLIRQLIAASRFHAPLQISTPILFLSSTNDKLVNSKCSQRLANMYFAKNEINEFAGHDIPLDDPEWVLSKVKMFINQISR